MNDIKPILQSRTVWANAVGLAALVLSLVGIEIGPDDANRLTEAALQVVTGLSFIASTAFRVMATRRIV